MNTQTMVAMFWLALSCIVVSAGMGIASIWVDDMWERYSWSWKLCQTSSVLAGTALLLAVIVWVFRWFLK
jgi:hypothetical protein